MQLRKSLVVQVFLILLAVFLCLLTISSLGIYSFARRSVSEEYIRLNQASLAYAAQAAGSTLDDICEFAEKLSINSRILELSTRQDKESQNAARYVLVELLSDFNDASLNGSALMEAYILTNNGLNISAYNTGRFTWDTVAEDSRFQPLLSGEVELLLLPTTASGSKYSIMEYSFQVAMNMRDLLTGDCRGIVLLDISEMLLHSCYSSYQDPDSTLSIVTQSGQIVSDKDKKSIGDAYPEDIALTAAQGTAQYLSGDHFLLREDIPGTDWVLVTRMSTEAVFGTLTQVRNLTLVLAFCCGLASAAVLILASRKIMRRVLRICDNMGNVVNSDLTVRIPVESNDEFGRIESAFNAMVEEIHRLISQIRQSEQQKRVAEMDFLHAQINSHFIHNTLTSIRCMLEMGKVEEAGEMIFYFSKLLRRTLSRSSTFVPLRDEVDTLQCYVMLQHYRYQNTFEATFDFEEPILDAEVPTLILQPVVENAIFHGARHAFTHIHIQGHQADGCLVITVEDDGTGMSEELQRSALQKSTAMNRVGLRNVHERIQLNYGPEYGLTIQSREGAGTKVIFTLPMSRKGGNSK